MALIFLDLGCYQEEYIKAKREWMEEIKNGSEMRTMLRS